MMRNVNVHQFYPSVYGTTASQGTIRVTQVNGIDNTWAIARPVSAPTPQYSPPASISRGSGVAFSPATPNVEMDPTNQQTWQRQYRFT